MMDINYNNLLSIENLQNAFNKARRKGTVGSDGVVGKKIIDRNGFGLNLREKILTDEYWIVNSYLDNFLRAMHLN